MVLQILTPKELEAALRLWRKGWNTLEIARVVHRTEAAVFNSLGRYRAELRERDAA